nr:zinc finger BED domain-containing protein DAYSLEEPER-like [Arachis hypogaea]
MDANDSRIVITTDMWTFNQEKGYMVVTAHYIDSSWNLQMRVLRDVFARLKQNDSNYKSVLSNEEWELAKEICVPTANIYFNKVCDIHVGLEKWAISLNPVISSMACMMKRKFDKIREDPNECTRKVERIKRACYELLHEYQKNTSNLSNMSVKSTQELRINADEDDDVEEDVYPLTPDFDILTWWKINGDRFPTLQKIARDIFAILVSTVASESSFSTSGHIIATHRGSLHEDMLEAFMCSQNWL